MDASYKIQRGIHVHLIQFFMCPEFWVHIKTGLRFCSALLFFDLYRCSTRSLISCVRPWFQNWVPM